MNQLSFFDYQQLDMDTQDYVRQRTDEIKALMRRSAQDIIEIGQKLIEVKARLKHGHFGNWLECEFAWTERTAQRFINVAERFNSDNLSDLSFAPSALYLLAAPSTPESAREEAIERAEQGEEITHQTAQEIVDGHKEGEEKEEPPPKPTEPIEEETEPEPIQEPEDCLVLEMENNGHEPSEGELIPDPVLELDGDRQAIAELELWEEEQIELGTVKRGLWIDPFIAEAEVIAEAIEYLNGYYMQKTGKAYIWRTE